jgi:hypothetical protein
MNTKFSKLLFAASLGVLILAAADGGWANKDIAKWSVTDAQEVLATSPWAKSMKPALLPGLSEKQRLDGGNMEAEGGGKSAGLGLADLTGIGTPRDRKAERTDLDKNGIPRSIMARWASALPIRAAEITTKDDNAIDLDGEDYAIAVYDVPLKGAMFNLDTRTLATALKQNAALKGTGRREIKPSRVVLRQDGSAIATIIYFFPRSAHITADDKQLLFTALVGRLFLSQYFNPPEMVFQGRLEL